MPFSLQEPPQRLYLHSQMDDRMVNLFTFHKQEYFLKIFWNGPSLSNSTTSAGVSAILTPHLDSCSHFWTSFPFLKLTPLKCVLLTAQKVTWNLNLFSSAKNLSTVPCSPSNKKPSYLSWHRKFSLSWLLPTSRVVSTHPTLGKFLPSLFLVYWIICNSNYTIFETTTLVLKFLSLPDMLFHSVFAWRTPLFPSRFILDIRSSRKSPLILGRCG